MSGVSLDIWNETPEGKVAVPQPGPSRDNHMRPVDGDPRRRPMVVREVQPPMMVREAPPPIMLREAPPPPPPIMVRDAPAPVVPTVHQKEYRQGDQFWMKACLVFCMLLLVIIVFQLNRTNRLLSKK